jgi:hypothetical protein
MEFRLAKCECEKPTPYKTTFGIQAMGCRKCDSFIIGKDGY